MPSTEPHRRPGSGVAARPPLVAKIVALHGGRGRGRQRARARARTARWCCPCSPAPGGQRRDRGQRRAPGRRHPPRRGRPGLPRGAPAGARAGGLPRGLGRGRARRPACCSGHSARRWCCSTCACPRRMAAACSASSAASPNWPTSPVYIISGASEVASLSTGTGPGPHRRLLREAPAAAEAAGHRGLGGATRSLRPMTAAPPRIDSSTRFASALAGALGQPVDAHPRPGEAGRARARRPRLRHLPARQGAEEGAPGDRRRARAGQLSVPGLQIVAAGPYVNARFAACALHRRGPRRGARGGASATAATDAGAGQDGGHRLLVAQHRQAHRLPPHPLHRHRPRASPTSTGPGLAGGGHQLPGRLGQAVRPGGGGLPGVRRPGAPARRWRHLVEVYVKANARAEKDPAFDEQARDFFRRMEDGDAEALALWKRVPRDLPARLHAHLRAAGHPLRAHRGREPLPGQMERGDRRDRPHRRASRSPTARSSSTCPTPRASRRFCSRRPTAARSTPRATSLPPRTAGSASTSTGRSTSSPRDQALHFRQVFRVLEGDGQAVGGPLHARHLRPGARA